MKTSWIGRMCSQNMDMKNKESGVKASYLCMLIICTWSGEMLTPPKLYIASMRSLLRIGIGVMSTIGFIFASCLIKKE